MTSADVRLPGRTPSVRSPATDAAWRALHRAACAPYRSAGRFAWHFAQGKLGRDPVFRSLLERGDLPAGAQVVDIGCGQGLLASLLHACDRHAAAWPAPWPAAPTGCRYLGIELMPRDVARAEAALQGLPGARFVCADMREAPLPACDVVVILDVLHYVDPAAQSTLLQRVHRALRPNGRLLLRVGDAAQRRGFVVSQWVDRLVTWSRGHRVPPTYGRTVPEWRQLLERLGFSVRPVQMSHGTPFANVLLVAEVQGASA